MKYLIHRSPYVLLLLLGITLLNHSQAVSLPTSTLSSEASDFVPAPPSSRPLGGQELWGVELDTAANPDVFCLDGTNPIFYVDEAVNGLSNKWVIHFQGGGSCSTTQECAEKYISTPERNEMSSLWAEQSISGKGILNPDPTLASNDFANYNRVKIKKCSFDRWMGNKSLQGQATQGANTLEFELYFHGRSIIKAVLNQLAAGINYHDETCLEDEACGTLPPLQEADVVLFTGSSGGGNGLTHAADDLANEVRNIQAACSSSPCNEADIRVVVDAAFQPGPDREIIFSAIPGIMTFTSAANNLPAFINYDTAVYTAPSGFLFVQQETWRNDRDNSCEDAHGIDSPECEDHLHILRYHLDTPVFIGQNLLDPNVAHVNKGNGWTPSWADSSLFPAIPDDYKNRVISQANMYIGLSIGGVPVRIFAPTCRQHVNLTNGIAFFRHQIENISTGVGRTYHDALSFWVTNPIFSAVIGVDDGTNFTTGNC